MAIVMKRIQTNWGEVRCGLHQLCRTRVRFIALSKDSVWDITVWLREPGILSPFFKNKHLRKHHKYFNFWRLYFILGVVCITYLCVFFLSMRSIIFERKINCNLPNVTFFRNKSFLPNLFLFFSSTWLVLLKQK